jgi:hypothetical protein
MPVNGMLTDRWAGRTDTTPQRRSGVEADELDPQAASVCYGGNRPSPDEADQVLKHLRDKGLGAGFVCRVLELSEST